jgi:hypothetical protein
MRGRTKLGGENVDRGVGEIADPSRVVEVEMGRHDVADVAWAVAQIRDLPERRLGDVEAWPRHRVEQKSEPPRLVDVVDPKPGIDQDQAVLALDQEAMTAHGGGRERAASAAEQFSAARTERPAIEMMNTHGVDPLTDLLSHISRLRPLTAPKGLYSRRLTDDATFLLIRATVDLTARASAPRVGEGERSPSQLPSSFQPAPGTFSCVKENLGYNNMELGNVPRSLNSGCSLGSLRREKPIVRKRRNEMALNSLKTDDPAKS